jgi:DNA sulfur modification protein DndC
MSKIVNLKVKEEIERLEKQVQDLYLDDDMPWIVGYSGGKDSTAVLQLTWSAISKLKEEQRTKKIYVISTDTLVENPVVSMWVTASLKKMQEEAEKQNLPIEPHRLTPEIDKTFWVNLIGRGYPAPRRGFRWCTERLKINPAKNFILNVIGTTNEAIMVLGVRKAESGTRKAVMEKYENSTRALLDRNSDPSLDRVMIYAPIKDWADDDVWLYIMKYKNPWGYDNHDLYDMYRSGTEDNECPLVVDTTTPSCGDSRFGCYVCTLVSKDKSMHAMIENDEEKKWMSPLSEFRNKYLEPEGDKVNREFRRRNGAIMINTYQKNTEEASLIPGPYKQTYRKILLTELLKAQEEVRKSGVKGTQDFMIITDEELQKIREIWVKEQHEIEDWVPKIYEKITERKYEKPKVNEYTNIKEEDLELLKETIGINITEDDIHYKLVRNLIDIEKSYSSSTRRTGIYSAIEKEIDKCSFETEKEGLEFKKKEQDIKGQYKKNTYGKENSMGTFVAYEDDEPKVGI